MTPVVSTPPPPRKASRRAPAIPAPQTVPWIIALEGGKGGSGKTMLACCLAFEALRSRSRVLLLDADTQATALTWAAVAAEAQRPVLLYAPSAPQTETGARIIVSPADDGLHQWVHELAAEVRADLVLIDCAGRLDKVQRASLAVADLVLLPCGPDPADLWALAKSADLVTEAMQQRPELRAAVLLNKLRENQALTLNARRAAPGAGLPVMKTELVCRTAYPTAFAAGRGPVAELRGEDKAAAEVAALYKEVLKLLRGRDRVLAESPRVAVATDPGRSS